MSGKVTSIRGNDIPAPGEVVPSVVDTLHDLLERAEAGDIKAVVGVAVHGDGSLYLFERGDSAHNNVRGALLQMAVNLG